MTKEEKEELDIPLNIEIIDESNPLNPLSPVFCGVSVYSQFSEEHFSTRKYSPTQTEHFARDPQGHVLLAKFLVEKFNLRRRGAVLEVGPGQNWHLIRAIHESGIPSSVIDGRQDPRWSSLTLGDDVEPMWHSPHKERTAEGLIVYSGDVRNLSENDSALLDSHFGLILFNGSWSARSTFSDFNYSVLWELWMREKSRAFRTHTEALRKAKERVHHWGVEAASRMPAPQYQEPDVTGPISRGIDEILDVCRDHLVKRGLIGIVSSRYSYRGVGWAFSRLPEEKLGFLDLLTRFQDKGAKRVYLAGVSPKGFVEATYAALDRASAYKGSTFGQEIILEVLDRLNSIAKLSNVKEASTRENLGLDQAAIDRIIARTQDIRALRKLARIDAIFAEF